MKQNFVYRMVLKDIYWFFNQKNVRLSYVIKGFTYLLTCSIVLPSSLDSDDDRASWLLWLLTGRVLCKLSVVQSDCTGPGLSASWPLTAPFCVSLQKHVSRKKSFFLVKTTCTVQRICPHTHTSIVVTAVFYNANTTPLLDWVWLSSSVAEWMTENQSPLYASVSVCLFVFFL